MRRLTIRARLTCVYGGLFLLAGGALLGVTYLLVSQRLLQPFSFRLPGSGAGTAGPRVLVDGSQTVPDTDVVAYLDSQANDLRQDTLNSLLTQGGIALALVGVVAVVMGWVLAGQVLAPLQRITDTAKRIGSAPAADRGLHERIALPGPADEVKNLADTFDDMLARLDHAFDGQRRFVANAAHELRTPLTLNRSLVEVAMHRSGASPDVRQLGELLLDINARHERLINGLLLLARTEQEVTVKSYVDVADIVEHVVRVTADLATGVGVDVTVEPGEAPVEGDALLLERLVQNLVENGIRHNEPGGWLKIRTGTDQGRAMLEVSNTGPVVARYDLPTLFEPFRRPGGERVGANGGTGLGLSIVRAVTRAHGGRVTAEPRPGGGLVVTVALPQAAPALKVTQPLHA
jgi:signal transduction histidine kinase